MLDVLLGGAVGVILAMTGAGGGVLAVPALVFGAGLETARAAPIALAAVGLSAGMGAIIGLRAGIVRYRAALLAAACGAIFSPLGAFAAQRLGNRALTVLFALVLAWVALRMLLPTPPRRARTPPCRCDGTTGRLV